MTVALPMAGDVSFPEPGFGTFAQPNHRIGACRAASKEHAGFSQVSITRADKYVFNNQAVFV